MTTRSNFWGNVTAVIAHARLVAKARGSIDEKGMADDSQWDKIETRENRLLRAVERLAGLPAKSLGVRDSS